MDMLGPKKHFSMVLFRLLFSLSMRKRKVSPIASRFFRALGIEHRYAGSMTSSSRFLQYFCRSLGRAGFSERANSGLHLFQFSRICSEVLDFLEQPLAVHVGVENHARGPHLNQGFRIPSLMIIGGKRKRDEYRSHTGRSDFVYRAGSGPRYNHISLPECFGHVLDERHDLSLKASAGEFPCESFMFCYTRLVDDAKTRPVLRKQRPAFARSSIEGSRPAAATRNKNAESPTLLR